MSLRPSLEANIEMNERARVGSIQRRILDDLTRQMRKLHLAVVADECTAAAGFDTRLTMLSIYGGEPAIHDLIRQSEYHRIAGAVAVKELEHVE